VGQLKSKARGKLLLSHWFPAVKGPRGCFSSSITIIWGKRCAGAGEIGLGHATGGLQRHGDGYVLALMEFHHWAHPYNDKGERCEFSAIPKQLSDSRTTLSQPGRGGAQGRWLCQGCRALCRISLGRFLSPAVSQSDLRSSGGQGLPESLVTEAVALARNPKAQFLPGWSGVTSNLHKPL
jgi:hypothetical protein